MVGEMHDTLSILSHQSRLLAKRWLTDGSIKNYDKAKYFKLHEERIESIHGLSALLSSLECNPNACIIRGKYVGAAAEQDADAEYREGSVLRRKDTAFIDQPLHTILIEVDQFQPLGSDPVLDPISSAEEFITSQLPKCFHGASYHWQLSNSAGHPSKRAFFKAHLWFWLKTAKTSAELRAWAEAIDCDRSVFDPIQLHYTAAPVVDDGAINPVSERSGFAQGTTDEVDLVIETVTNESRFVAKRGHIQHQAQDDEIAAFLDDCGLVLGQGSRGQLHINCPFSDGHSSGEDGDSSTSYLPKGTGGNQRGHFKCFHSSCEKRPDGDFLEALGYNDVMFEPLPPEPAQQDTGAPSESTIVKRFQWLTCSAFTSRPRPDWIVKDVLPRAELAVIFGESGAGKSFFALDLAMAIARGVSWNGKKVKQGRVVYICAEGVGGFRNRLEAYLLYNQITKDDVLFHVIPDTPNLLQNDDLVAISNSILSGGKADVVIIDTFAQSTPGANENSAEDIGKALSHCKCIHRATGALVVLVHHAGKDLTKGPRGWSGLHAAADAEIEVSRGKDGRKARVSKQKDGDDNNEWAFKLNEEIIEMDEDDEPVISCVVEFTGKPTRAKKEKPRGVWEQLILDVWGEKGERNVPVKEIVKEAKRRAPHDEGKDDRRRDNLLRAIQSLAKDGIFKVLDDQICSAFEA